MRATYLKSIKRILYGYIEREIFKGRKVENIVRSMIKKRKRVRLKPSPEFDKALNEIASEFLNLKRPIKRSKSKIVFYENDTVAKIYLNRTNIPTELITLVNGLKDIGRLNDFIVEALNEKIYAEKNENTEKV